jgi:3-oxoacyl-[acyl-carrier-protein] synthase III
MIRPYYLRRKRGNDDVQNGDRVLLCGAGLGN